MDRKSIFKLRLMLLFALVAMLGACAVKNQQQSASPTPYTEPNTAAPTDIALPEDEFTVVPGIEQMRAQAKKGTPWYVRVDARNQIISVYALDQNKRYTLLVNRFACSVPQGLSPMLLQSGQALPLKKMKMLNDPVAQDCCSEFCIALGDVLSLRSVPVLIEDLNRSDGAVHNRLTLGTDRPYIVVSSQDARWLYEHLKEGFLIEVAFDSPDPDLVQWLMPLPYVDGCGIPQRKESFTMRMTGEPPIAWGSLNDFIDRNSEQE